MTTINKEIIYEEYKKQIKIKWDGSEYVMPGVIKKELDILFDDLIDNEMDILIVIDGKEGTGKSWTARLIGEYFANLQKKHISSNNIHFTTQDYIKCSENGKIGQINIMDESREALNKKRGMSSSNVLFTNWLSENRDKRQIHIIILPAVHDLDSYVSLWRMSLLIHMRKKHIQVGKSRSGYGLDRGWCRVYANNKHLQEVLHNKQKWGHYKYPEPQFCVAQNKFIYSDILSSEEKEKYREKKAEKRKAKYTEDIGEKQNADRGNFERLVKHLSEKGYTQQKIADLVSIDRTNVSRILKKYKKSAKINILEEITQ